MLKRNLIQTITILLLIPAFIIGQTSGGGLIGGGSAIGGGKVDNVLKKEVTTVFNKKILTGLGQKIGKNSGNKTTSAKKTTGKTITAKNPSTVAKKNSNPLPTENNQTALNFEPTGDTGFDLELARLLTQKADEQEVLLTIFRETKKAYNIEAQKLGRENDVALATTFFVAACITVYHQSPEPSDEATDALYNSLAEEMLSSPETAKMSNEEKQLASDKLVYLGGLILGGYLISKENGDQETVEAYRQIAAVCFQEFTNLNVAEYEFTATGLKTKS